MKPIIQKDKTGCALACIAMLTGKSYSIVKRDAKEFGISHQDTKLWSDITYVLKLCSKYNVHISSTKTPFQSWESLPDRALLAIKWHEINEIPFWHWVVFIREKADIFVLDPSTYIKNNRRTDFGRIKPKWFLEVHI